MAASWPEAPAFSVLVEEEFAVFPSSFSQDRRTRVLWQIPNWSRYLSRHTVAAHHRIVETELSSSFARPSGRDDLKVLNFQNPWKRKPRILGCISLEETNLTLFPFESMASRCLHSY